jgi:hypothetical protein
MKIIKSKHFLLRPFKKGDENLNQISNIKNQNKKLKFKRI